MKDWLKNLWAKIKAYIGVDGLLHFLICYAIVVTFGLIDFVAGVVVAVGLSIFKECWDYANATKAGGKWGWKHTLHDLLFDLFGILVGVGVCLWLK